MAHLRRGLAQAVLGIRKGLSFGFTWKVNTAPVFPQVTCRRISAMVVCTPQKVWNDARG